MELTRRSFLAGAGLAAAAAATFAPTGAWADDETGAEAPAGGEQERRPIVCEGCPLGCTGVIVCEDGAALAVVGDEANPFTGGKLCARGQRLLDAREERDPATGEKAANPRRLATPRVRRPGAAEWEDISWDMALDEIAALVKKTRDESFVEYEGELPVMRTEGLASFGGAKLLVEEQYLLMKALRSWGVVHLDSEAAGGRRVFGAGAEATFGIAEPSSALNDMVNSQVILTVGADHAASQPLTARWIEQARDRGARWIVVDPVRSRTAEMADTHVALRPGTDIAFFGGLVKYILDHSLWQPEYVLNYTSASFLLDDGFAFDSGSGLFSGWDPFSGAYDKAHWGWQIDGEETWNMRYEGEFAWVRGEGVPVWAIPSTPKPVRDITLQHPSSTWMRLQEFYGRYDLDAVSAVCGVDRAVLEGVYEIVAATGAPDRAAKIIAGAGLVQHGTGAQAARAACVAQLLLGNVGLPGGGIAYAGGSAGEATADVVGLRPDWLPGGMAWPTTDDGTLQAWLEARVAPAGSHAQDPKRLVSVLREWWGAAATPENDYGYDWLPKRAAGAQADLFAALAAGTVRGCFTWSADLLAAAPGGFDESTLGSLEWIVAVESALDDTASFWNAPGVDAATVGTTVYVLPAAAGPEKGGLRASGRMVQHADAALEPFGESLPELAVIGDLWRRVRNLYDTKGGTGAAPLLNAQWNYLADEKVDPARVAWALNGYVVEDSDFDSTAVRLLEGPDGLRADGTVACAVPALAGCWNSVASLERAAEQPVGRRDAADESGLGLFPQWGFTWPGNVRVRGNRASANLAGQPWAAADLLHWDGQSWVFIDQPDFAALRDGRWLAPDNRAFPGLWEETGLLASDRLGDGPLPEHYEPLESSLNNRLNGSYASPVLMAAASRAASATASAEDKGGAEADAAEGTADGAAGAGAVDTAVQDALAPDYHAIEVDRTAYPIVAVVNNGRGETAALRGLSAAARAFEPGCFVEVSPALARIRNLATGDTVRVFNERGSLEAPVLVTGRVAPFPCEDSEAHVICLNGMAPRTAASAPPEVSACYWNRLAPAAAGAAAGRDGKGFLVNIEKA